MHVWVDAECMCECMVNACVSGCWVYVWVHGECMCEWRDHINALMYSLYQSIVSLIVAVLLMPLRCCCRGMCCPSTQHVWVEAECVYEWMPSACVSGWWMHVWVDAVYVWVDGECMCEWWADAECMCECMVNACVSGEWMLSVCVSAWWMHVWVDAECMCEWRDHINALIYSISINSIAYIINKIYMTSIRIASFILVQLQCSCMHPVI